MYLGLKQAEYKYFLKRTLQIQNLHTLKIAGIGTSYRQHENVNQMYLITLHVPRTQTD